MRDGKVHATERELKRLLKGQTRALHDGEIPEIEGAGKVIEKLTKRVKKLEDEVAVMRPTCEELRKWKMEQERRSK